MNRPSHVGIVGLFLVVGVPFIWLLVALLEWLRG
jgi:hypothetical protein